MPAPSAKPDVHIGKVVKPQGIKGELKVLLAHKPVEPYLELKEVFLELDAFTTPHQIEQIRPLDTQAVGLKLRGVDDRNAAERLRNQAVRVHGSQLPRPEPGQLYCHELEGLLAVDDATGTEIGTIIQVLEMPGQDVLEVAAQGAKVLIPLAEPFIVGLDKQAGVLHLRLPEGLLDVYLGGPGA
ncbi:MAG: ribosome maturation factor RimM [Bacteroidetes bacterium]|jgi:16S rRNA processing protein RimM|nr:ribosome maturation factor RimM [Bacteroidota bacterium]